MAKRRAPYDRSKRPLGAAKLDELALAYVARFATSRAKLMRYLSRKVRESEWIDDSDAMAACAVIADRMELLAKWPGLKAYVDRATDRPAYREAVAEQIADFEGHGPEDMGWDPRDFEDAEVKR